MNPDKLTIQHLQNKKRAGEKITMLTAYDYPLAVILDNAGVDMVLVGDSLANVALGLESTRDVGMSEMLHHAKAVRRGVRRALVVGDMPYESYQTDPDGAVANARRFIDEAGCDAVKLEWFDAAVDTGRAIVQSGIPVMGHVGLTPQTADRLGGFKVQGRDAEAAARIVAQARALEKAGCFAVVLECVPDRLASLITQHISIPTIGIGAGAGCDGQVLVTHDALGLFDRFRPKFAKRFVEAGGVMSTGVQSFCREVGDGAFPSQEQSFAMTDEQFQQLSQMLSAEEEAP